MPRHEERHSGWVQSGRMRCNGTEGVMMMMMMRTWW